MAKGKSEDNRLDWVSVRRAFGYLARLWPYLKPQWRQFLLVALGGMV